MTLPSPGLARTHCILGRAGNPHQQAEKQGGGPASPDKPMAKPGIAARSPHGSSPTRNRKKPQSLPLKSGDWQPARPHGELGVCCELPPPAQPRSQDRHIWGERAQLEGLGMHGWGEQMCTSGWKGHARRLGSAGMHTHGWAGRAHLGGAGAHIWVEPACTSGQVVLTHLGRLGRERAASIAPRPRVPLRHTLGCFFPSNLCAAFPSPWDPRHPNLPVAAQNLSHHLSHRVIFGSGCPGGKPALGSQ